MSKMAEMAQTIEELRSAAASINTAADWLYQQFSGDDTEAQPADAPAKTEQKPVIPQRYAPCLRSTVPTSSLRSIRQSMKLCFRTRR